MNLNENKESYTAYNGTNVWRAIYEENCMLEVMQNKFINPKDQCSEETLLYQLISGIHASVNMHVARNYYDQDTNTSYPNHTMYFYGIGNHPDRLKNLHLVYAITMRALNVVHEQLITHDYTTGLCIEQDQMSQKYMRELLTQTIGECQSSFNESKLFSGRDQKLLLREI